jgi:DNA primase
MDYKRVGSSSHISWIKPPRIDTNGFDQKALRILAEAKLLELYKQKNTQNNHLERLEKTKQCLTSNDLVIQLGYKVKVYEKIQELHYISLWARYWKRIGDLFPKTENKLGFSDKEIQTARDYPIENLVGNVRRAGSKFTTKCPFHNKEGERERSQSFFVYEDGSFYCFSCQARGANSIDFLMQTENLDFKEAVRRLL